MSLKRMNEIAVGGFVLEPHCSLTVGWGIGSVRRDDHQVSMTLVSCSSLESDPGPSTQFVGAAGSDKMGSLVED